MADKIIYISFFDSIDPVKVNKFIQFTSNVLQQHNPTELYFFISSPGGDVDSGFVLFNYLESLKGNIIVTMHNFGTVDSIANIIFLAGQNRFAAPNASFLFHGVAMNFNAGPVSRTLLKENLSRLDGIESRMAATMSKYSKLTEEDIKGLFQQGESKDVSFAIEKGIITEIKVPAIPQGAVHLAMTFV